MHSRHPGMLAGLRLYQMQQLQQAQQVKAWFYEMEGAAAACVERYRELAKIKPSQLRKVGTPCLDDHLLGPEDFVTSGVLSNVCFKAVVKCCM